MRALERVIGVAAAVLLFGMMALTLIDVLGRTLLGAPVPAAYDVTELAMGLSIYVALPLTTWRREHITIKLFDRYIRGSLRKLQMLLVDLLTAVVLALFAWRLWIQGDKFADSHNTMILLGIEIAPAVYCMAVLSGIAALLSCVAAWRRLRQHEPGNAPHVPV